MLPRCIPSRDRGTALPAVARLGIVDAIRVRQSFATNGKRNFEGGVGGVESPPGGRVLTWRPALV